MSQLPNATYTPTANPLQTGIVPFQASIPQQVEIGGGTAQLGAAFSQFSQTLAQFVGNQVSTNRVEAIAQGELKAQKSRKSFRQLVESGEIKPEENPWEALGAASADAVMHAERFKLETRTQYDQKVMTDPSFATNVGAVEDFLNQRIQNELTVGMDNPVWQRSFMKEAMPFMSSISAFHGANVAQNRRTRILEGVKVSVNASISDMLTEQKMYERLPTVVRPGDKADSEVIEANYTSRLQANLDEAFQTIGPDANKAFMESALGVLIQSGSDPRVERALKGVKSGTGSIVDSKAFKAIMFERRDDIERAKVGRDSALAVDAYVASLRNLEPMDFDQFSKAVKSFRPDASPEYISDIYAATQKVVGPVKDQMFNLNKNAMIQEAFADMSRAYSTDATGMLSSDAGSVLARDPAVIKTRLSSQLIALREKMGMPVDFKSVNSEVDVMYQIATQQAGMSLYQSSASDPPERQAQVLTAFADRTGASIPNIAMVTDAVSNMVTYKSDAAFRANQGALNLGLAMYREIRLRGGDYEKFGMTPATRKFFESMGSVSSLDPTGNAGTSALHAAQQAPLSALSDPDGTAKYNEALYTAAGQDDYSKLHSHFTVYQMGQSGGLDAPKDAIVANFAKWKAENVITVNNQPIVLPQGTPVELRNADAITTLETAMLKAMDPATTEIEAVTFRLAPGGQNFQVYVKDKGRDDYRIPTLEESEMLNKAKYSPNFGPKEATQYLSETAIKNKVNEVEYKRAVNAYIPAYRRFKSAVGGSQPGRM
jgi:hypothetical protein